MTGDALWYEAAQVVGITNALNVAADTLDGLEPVDESSAAAEVWAATRHAFTDHCLARRLKEALAFAVSVTSRSASGAAFHLSEMRRLGVGPQGVMEIVGVTQMFSSYTKIADTLQLEPDMGDIAPEDPSPAPGAAPRGDSSLR